MQVHYVRNTFRNFLLVACLASAPVISESKLPVGSVVILGSGPWDNAYSATEATKTRTWVHIRSDAIAALQPGERLKLWLQWAPSDDGPWKTRSKGEIEVRPKRNYVRPHEHVSLKTRGYVHKDVDNSNEATLEMGFLTRYRTDDALPFYRVAQALRKPGEKWNRTARKTLQPEENHANYSSPFQAELGIIFAYRPEYNKKGTPPPRFDTTDVHPDQPGPWTNLSFNNIPSTTVSFFVGLGGINCGSIVPAIPFEVSSSAGELQFWACHPRPKSFREEHAKSSNSMDTQWWGVCPVRVPIPPMGESVSVPIQTTIDGREYSKTFRVFGREPTPAAVAAHKVYQIHYDLLLTQFDPTTPQPHQTDKELADAMGVAQQTFMDIRDLFYQSGKHDEYAAALANAYIAVLELENQEVLLKRNPPTKEKAADARLRTLLTLAVLARNLQKWHEMSAHLDTYYNSVMEALSTGTLTQQSADHYLHDSFPDRSRAPFSNQVDGISFLNLLKEWAWTMSDPTAFQRALDSKKAVTPQEYRELAELIIERTGERDKAEAIWRKATDLQDRTDDKRLHMERPGWWSE